MPIKTKTSNEKLAEIIKWKKDNKATWSQAAEKFSFSSGDNLYQTYKRRMSTGKFKSVRKAYTKKSAQSFDVPLVLPKAKTVAVFMIPLNDIQEFMGNL